MKPFPRTAIAFSLAAAFTVAGTQHAEAQESDWQIDFGASVQLTTISGDIGFTGVDNARTLSLGDLVSNVQPGFAIEFDVWKGDWGVLTDVFTVEYEGNPAVFCEQANAWDFDTLKKRLNLNAWRYACR